MPKVSCPLDFIKDSSKNCQIMIVFRLSMTLIPLMVMVLALIASKYYPLRLRDFRAKEEK